MKIRILTLCLALVPVAFYHSACNTSEPTPADTNRDSLTIDTIPHDFPMPDTSMVLVKGGTFRMGSQTGAYDEKPVHEVTVSDFFISRYELTVAFYNRILNRLDKKNPYPKSLSSFTEVMAFIDTLRKVTGINYRLPTEAEWEYAARGGRYSKGYTWAGSNDIDAVGWSYGTDIYAKKPGQLKPNELGLYDMSGNMIEWCSDFYDPGYYARSAPKNPRGPETGLYRVLRGGFIRHTANECRVFARFSEQEMSISGNFEKSLVGERLVVGRE
jgi:sulfatase modifying factor 1